MLRTVWVRGGRRLHTVWKRDCSRRSKRCNRGVRRIVMKNILGKRGVIIRNNRVS